MTPVNWLRRFPQGENGTSYGRPHSHGRANDRTGLFVPLLKICVHLRNLRIQLPRTVFLGAEALPLVFKDKIACPILAGLAALRVFQPDDLPLKNRISFGVCFNKLFGPWLGLIQPLFNKFPIHLFISFLKGISMPPSFTGSLNNRIGLFLELVFEMMLLYHG